MASARRGGAGEGDGGATAPGPRRAAEGARAVPSRLARQVREFHERVGADVRGSPTAAPDGAARRCEFIEEEARELRQAVEAGDVVGIADALGDLAYVVYGAALHFGIDLDRVTDEIHASNMTKEPAGNGKAVKGPGYRSPDLGAALGRDPRPARR